MPVSLNRTPYQKQVWIKSLLESGMTLRAIAKAASVSQDTVLAVKRLFPSNTTDVEQCKKTVVGSFYGLARGCQEHITVSKLEESSAYQLMGMASLAVQAARDMEGFNRPIINVMDIAVNISKLVEESKNRLNALSTTLEDKDTSTLK